MPITDPGTKKPERKLTAVPVAIGFCLAAAALLLGGSLVSPVVVLTVGGAVAGAVLLAMRLRVRSRIPVAEVRPGRLDGQLERLEGREEVSEMDVGNEQLVEWLDLAAMGSGDPGRLVAATLDRSTFPRLLTSWEEDAASEPSPGVSASAHESPDHVHASGESPEKALHRSHRLAGGVTRLSQLRRWKLGLRTGDLAACRAAFSALVDTADPSTVASREEQLEALADRTEKSLRAAFSRCLVQKDFVGMLAVGHEICRLLPDRPVAADFLRIKPHLLRRQTQRRSDASSSLRIVN